MNTKAFNDILGKEIKRVREERKITQEELASRMNVNPQNISSYERGERCPSLFWMNRLYTALGIDPAQFTEGLYQRLKEDSLRNKDSEPVSTHVIRIKPVDKNP